jgi:phosphatidylserine synthase
MEYPREDSKSLYDYSDKSIPHAGYAAIAYAVISTPTTGLAWFKTPSTPWVAIVIVALLVGLFFGALAFGIFKKSRVAVILMLAFVIGLQLYTWTIMRSPSGSLLSIIVTGFLLRGARRIFQDHAEQTENSGKA